MPTLYLTGNNRTCQNCGSPDNVHIDIGGDYAAIIVCPTDMDYPKNAEEILARHRK